MRAAGKQEAEEAVIAEDGEKVKQKKMKGIRHTYTEIMLTGCDID
jgi:hypothetical protein